MSYEWTGTYREILKGLMDDLTASEVARRSNCSVSTVTRMISGERPLTRDMCERIIAGCAKELNRTEISQLREDANTIAVSLSRGKEEEIEERELSSSEKRRLTMAQKHFYRHVSREVNKGTFIVTTAMQGADVFGPGLSACETFCTVNKARLIVLPSQAHHAPLGEREYPLDEKLVEEHWQDIYRSFQFNKFLTASDLDVRPYQPDPLQALNTLGADMGHSYIVAHPTQRLKSFHGEKQPRIQWATGAITLPKYKPTTSGKMAATRHVLGALIVEISADKFFIRPVQFADDGSFYDIAGGKVRKYDADLRYHENGPKKVELRASLLARGDEHAGWGDPSVIKAVDDLTKLVHPLNVTVEDLLDCSSVSHHTEKKLLERVSLPAHVATLESEAATAASVLSGIVKSAPSDCSIVIKPSNHHRHLTDYLDYRRYVNDFVNYKLAIKLEYLRVHEGKDPVKVLCDPEGKARWLAQDESFKVEGIEYGHHLHLGPGGSRGTTRSAATSYGKAGGGHQHGAEILWGVWRTGTMTGRRLSYNKGPNNWGNAVEVMWPGGQRQLIFIIDGKFCL